MDTIKVILSDPSVHYWVKDQYRAALDRDIVDAVNDARLLVKMLEATLRNS